MTEHENRNPFGNWNNTDERLEELNNRLAAWYLAGEQLPEIFTEALRRLQVRYREHDVPMLSPATSLLEAFESALDSFDNILETFPEELTGDND